MSTEQLDGDRRLRDQFVQDGYVVIKGLLEPDEVAAYRAELQRLSGLSDEDYVKVNSKGGWAYNDAVTRLPQFWPLIFNERLVSTARAIIGPDARYTQHSDLLVHAGRPGWHRDSADREFGSGSDWDESRGRYRIARVAIYLQSHQESGSGLGVIPGSHRHENFLNSFELKVWDFINSRRVKKGKQTFLPRFLSMRSVSVDTDPGDCLFFDERLLHSATKIRGPKYAIFLSYGGDDHHSRRLLQYWIDRPDADYGEYPPELAEKLKEADLFLPRHGGSEAVTA